MSGLEVAGLVLGALPLVIKAVQSYRATLYPIKHVKRDLDNMERDLEIEQLRLLHTCEALLVGIVPHTKMQSMIEDPFGPEWKSYADDLTVNHVITRLRLYTSNYKFHECIVEMSRAVNSQDQTSILEAFKRNTSFALRRKDYDDLLSRVKAIHRELEPDRRRRSQTRVTKLLRGLSKNIYNALHSTITCACVQPLNLGLQLIPRDAIMLPYDTEEQCLVNLPPFGFEERLQAALALSVNMLHLDGTPWLVAKLGQTMTLDNIILLVANENLGSQPSYSLYQPFIMKSIPKTSILRAATFQTPPSQTSSLLRPVNLSALSLGALLIQIIVGRADNELEVTDTADIRSLASKRARGSQLEEEVLVNGGMNYAAAVKWCLDSIIYGVAGWQDDKFCQNFHEAVIARLEDDIKVIGSVV
ncbi:hypothetical protein F5Y09DRAFT_335209 [Xylaria sp. FL1042]|nr:hypothetical protein F5Y09DRAFT_335209 [Xylaria sp. FL1042]